ncbi:MAG: hypothetical protein ACKVWV_11830 [Planctomycetota bacterium]
MSHPTPIGWRRARVLAALALLLVAGAVGWLLLFETRATTRHDALAEQPVSAHEAIAELSDAVTAEQHERVSDVARSVASASTDATLVVRVLAIEDGTPLHGARLTVAVGDTLVSPVRAASGSSRGDLATRPLTDASGVAEFSVPAHADLGVWTFWSQNGTTTHVSVAALEPGERRELVLRVRRDDRFLLRGRVIDAHNRQPIASANVRATARSGFRKRDAVRETLAETTTAGDGSFELVLETWSAEQVEIAFPGYALALEGMREDDGDPRFEYDVALVAAAELRVAVLDETDTAVEGARVELRGFALGEPRADDFDWSSRLAAARTQLTGVQGVARFDDLPPATAWRLSIDHESGISSQEPRALLLESGERRELVVRLPQRSRITGRLRDEHGAAIEGGDIALTRAATTTPRLQAYGVEPTVATSRTDANGSFTFVDVPPGLWRVGLRARELSSDLCTLGIAVRVPDDLELGAIELTAYRGYFVNGRVDPLPSAPTRSLQDMLAVVARSADGFGDAHAIVEPTGEFAIGPLVPGRYGVVLLDAVGGALSDDVFVEAGRGDIVLVPHASGALTVRVLTANSRRARDARVAMSGSERTRWVGTGSGGEVTLRALRGGTHRIRASARDGSFAEIHATVVAGETREATITLAPGARLTLAYNGPHAAVECTVQQAGALVCSLLLPSGHAVVVPTAPGDAHVRVSAEGRGLQDCNLNLAPGAERMLLLDD